MGDWEIEMSEDPSSPALWLPFPKSMPLRIIFGLFLIAGPVVSFTMTPPEWSFAAKLLVGLLLGYGAPLILFGNHLLMGE